MAKVIKEGKKKMNKPSITNPQAEEFAKVLIFIRHVQNNYKIQDPVDRVLAASEAGDALQRALGKDIDKVYLSKAWNNS